MKIKRGTTSKRLRVRIDDSSSTTGAGLTGLAWNTAGLVFYYYRDGDTSAQAVTITNPPALGTYTSGGFKEVDATNLPGVYEVGIPSAALSTGELVVVGLKGAANMVPVVLQIELDAVDYQDAQRFGLNALPASGTLANNTLSAAAVRAEMDANSTRLSDIDDQSLSAQTNALTAAAQSVAINTKLGTPAGATISADLAALQTAVNAIPTTGIGPLARTVVVVDGNGAAIAGASVGMTGGYVDATDGSGQVIFNHNAGAFTIRAAKAGYVGASAGPANLIATGATTLTMAGLALSIPDDPDYATGHCITRDGQGVALPSETLSFTLVDPYPADDDAERDAWSRDTWTVSSDTDGLLQTTFKRSATYRGKWRGDWVEIDVPDEASFELPKILSRLSS